MSLDVYLHAAEAETGPTRAVIFVREDGQTRELSRAEWDERYPGAEPVAVETRDSVFECNITHNLTKMADAAGIYEELWRPDEIAITHARELIEPLTAGLERLRADPEKFKALNPPNGWGDYDGLVRFVSAYLEACRQHPDATVYTSR
jgi:hypothetical protein